MKIKKIIDLCVKRKAIHLYTDKETKMQWLSDGYAIYPLEKVPHIDIAGLCVMYDIDEKKRKNMALPLYDGLPENLNLSDSITEESEAELLDLAIHSDGCVLIPLKTEEGLIYINGKYLSPLADSDSSALMFYLRHDTNNTPYIVVKQGLLLIAAMYTLLPTESFVEKLGEIYSASKVALVNGAINEKP